MKYGGYYSMKLTEKDYKALDELEASDNCPTIDMLCAWACNTQHKISFSRGKDGIKCVVTHEMDYRDDGLQTYMSAEADNLQSLAILMHYKVVIRLKGKLPVHDAPSGALGKWGR